MPLFVCDKCECTDNTACGGTWHTRHSDKIWADEDVGKVLCAECAPATYRGGEPREKAGQWHGRFEKRKMTEEKARSDASAHYVWLGRFEEFRGRKFNDHPKNG